MSTTAQRHGMTLEEFLAWDEGQEGRWEFDGYEPIAMVGGTRAHSIIATNLIAALVNRLRGTPCRAFNNDLRLEVAGSIRYPEAFVSCTPGANNARAAENPVVVFEVLSPSTAHTDHFVKNMEYRATPSIQRYVMLSQDRVAATVFARDGEAWVGTLVAGWGVVLDMPEIGISVLIDELYDGVIEPE